MNHVLYVKTLGGFALEHVGAENRQLEVTEKDSNSWRQWAFLGYLCVYHQRAISQEEMIDVVWGGDDSGSPANTIKTLLHRARLLLERLGFPDGKKILIYRRGVYSWNPDLKIRVDIEDFDDLREQFDSAAGIEAKIEIGRKAIELYKGDFLPHASASPWAIAPRTHYHLKYLLLACDTATALWEQGLLDEAIAVCSRAMEVDPYDEACQVLMMRLLHATGTKQAAARYYGDISALMMKEFGVSPSEELTTLYHELSGQEETQELDLRTIRTMILKDDEKNKGAFFCQYSIFRNICRLLARTSARNGQIVQLGVITIFSKTGGRMSVRQRTSAIGALKSAIQENLRAGDIFTQFSPTQFLLLLPTASRENGSMAVDRALDAYGCTLVGMSTSTQFNLLPALSLDFEGGR